jgi:hypothetical protein
VAGDRRSPRATAEDLVAAALPAALAAALAAASRDGALVADRTSGASYRPAAGRLLRRASALRDAAIALAAADPRATSPVTRVALDAARGSAPLAVLAAAELAVLDAWTGLALRTALGADRDAYTGRVVAITTAGALPMLLASAERAARAHAAAALAATGSVPLEARLAYQDARAREHGDVADRVAALALWWRSSAWSQLAVALARDGEPALPLQVAPAAGAAGAGGRPPSLPPT